MQLAAGRPDSGLGTADRKSSSASTINRIPDSDGVKEREEEQVIERGSEAKFFTKIFIF